MRTVMEIVVEKIMNLEIFVLERLTLKIEIEVGHTSFKTFQFSNWNFFKPTWTCKFSNFRLTNFYFFHRCKKKFKRE